MFINILYFLYSFDLLKKLSEQLKLRDSEIIDYSFRIYAECESDFIINRNESIITKERRAADEAITIGSIWLDIYSRYISNNEKISGIGSMKLTDSWKLITKRQLNELNVSPSPIATYLHDEADLFL